MTNVRAEIIGLKELDVKFDRLGAVGKGKILETALVAGALIINNAAKRLAPWKTGTLRRSLHVGGHVAESTASSGDNFIPSDIAGTYSDVGGAETGETSASVVIGTNLVYAAAQEFGFSPRNIPAHPYLRPAFDENIEKAKETIGEVIKVLVEQAAK